MSHGATAHKARLSMNTLHAAFPGRLISRFGDIQWHSNSPDFTAADFLWGYLKAQVLLTPSLTLTALKCNSSGDCEYYGGHCNALIFMEDIFKILYGRLFCESKTMTYLTVLSCIYCCVQ
jgi:hypothetical protein